MPSWSTFPSSLMWTTSQKPDGRWCTYPKGMEVDVPKLVVPPRSHSESLRSSQRAPSRTRISSAWFHPLIEVHTSARPKLSQFWRSRHCRCCAVAQMTWTGGYAESASWVSRGFGAPIATSKRSASCQIVRSSQIFLEVVNSRIRSEHVHALFEASASLESEYKLEVRCLVEWVLLWRSSEKDDAGIGVGKPLGRNGRNEWKW